MTLFFSLIIYILFALTLYRMGLKSSHLGMPSSISIANVKPSAKLDKYMWWAIVVFTIMAAFRYRVGSDCEGYAVDLVEDVSQGIYDSGHDGRDVEPLAILLYKIVIFLGGSRIFALGAFAFFEAYFLWKSFSNRKFLLPFISLLLILGPFWIPFNNGLRQVLVSCIFLYAVQQLIDYRNWKLYILLIFISYFIHHSCLILVPGILLLLYNILPNRYMMLGALALAVLLSSTGFIKPYIALTEGYISMLGYSDYANSLSVYLDQDGVASNYGPRRIVILLSYVLVMFYSKDIDKHVGGNQFYRVTILLFFVYVFLSELLLSSSFIFTRPLGYIRPFVLVSEAYLLTYLKQSKRYFVLFLAAVFMCSYTCLECIAVYNDPEEMSLYKFIFLKDLY